MKYTNEELNLILKDIIEKYGTEEEAEQFILDHLEFTSFRESWINKFIQQNNFKKVLELAIEGEEKDKNLLGLVEKIPLHSLKRTINERRTSPIGQRAVNWW